MYLFFSTTWHYNRALSYLQSAVSGAPSQRVSWAVMCTDNAFHRFWELGCDIVQPFGSVSCENTMLMFPLIPENINVLILCLDGPVFLPYWLRSRRVSHLSTCETCESTCARCIDLRRRTLQLSVFSYLSEVRSVDRDVSRSRFHWIWLPCVQSASFTTCEGRRDSAAHGALYSKFYPKFCLSTEWLLIRPAQA